MHSYFRALLLISLLSLAFTPARLSAGTAAKAPAKPASVKAEQPPVTLTVTPARVTAAPGGKFTLALAITVAKGWHINSHTPYQDYLIPTAVTIASAQPVTVAPVIYPAGSDLEFAGEKLSVYAGTMKLPVTLTLPKKAKAGKCELKVTLRFQACDGTSCLAPDEVTVKVPVTVKISQPKPQK